MPIDRPMTCSAVFCRREIRPESASACCRNGRRSFLYRRRQRDCFFQPRPDPLLDALLVVYRERIVCHAQHEVTRFGDIPRDPRRIDPRDRVPVEEFRVVVVNLTHSAGRKINATKNHQADDSHNADNFATNAELGQDFHNRHCNQLSAVWALVIWLMAS